MDEYRTACSNPTTITSITAVTHGTSSSTSPLKEFIEEVRDMGGLMRELHSASDSERAGLEYLERVARGMETLK